MRTNKRRNHSTEFKAREALEAIRGIKTVSQISVENYLHPVHVTHVRQRFPDEVSLSTITGEGIPDIMEHLAALMSISLQHVFGWKFHIAGPMSLPKFIGKGESYRLSMEMSRASCTRKCGQASKFREFHKTELFAEYKLPEELFFADLISCKR